MQARSISESPESIFVPECIMVEMMFCIEGFCFYRPLSTTTGLHAVGILDMDLVNVHCPDQYLIKLV